MRQGIAAYVLDHHSTDGTVAALEPLLSGGLVRIETFPPAGSSAGGGFRWADILTRKEQLARELDADWFIHHDADEFRESPWPHLNLREGVALVDRLGYNAIDFAVLNFWPTQDGFDGASDIRELFQHYEPADAFDRRQVKCWKKNGQVDLVSTGGHEAQFPSRRVFPLRFILRHYPVRGQAHGTRKVFEERKPRFSAEERRQGWHVQYDAFRPGHQFLRDPRTLRRYDADEVRVQLQAHNRECEELSAHAETARRERDDLAVQLAESRSALQAAVERGEAEAAHVRRLREQLDEHVREHERTKQALLARIEDLDRHIVDLRQSWSWRLTAPLRTLWRLLR